MSFKVIIAGSRDFNDYNLLKNKCDSILSKVDEEIWVISGTSKGADTMGEDYAHERGFYVMECPAPWNDIEDKPPNQIGRTEKGILYWKRAEDFRNKIMIKEADALILFNMKGDDPDNLLDMAKKQGLKIREIKI